MSPADARDLLDRAWRPLAARAGWAGPADAVDGAGQDLIARYARPERHYHDLTHLAECLAELDTAADGPAGAAACDDFVAVATALWFHDAVYDPTRSDNEAASADLAAARLATLGASPAEIARVRQLVLDTAHRADPATPDGRLIVDVDLAILGQPADRFDRYDRAIRLEYAHVPEAAYRAGRAAVLRGFLNRAAIYRTDRFAARYEVAARDNLRRALVGLAEPAAS